VLEARVRHLGRVYQMAVDRAGEETDLVEALGTSQRRIIDDFSNLCLTPDERIGNLV
jgi:hypothetical protein